jgi:hypothetical protein
MQGLSEPIGALVALVAVKPFISEEPLHYILAFVGGIMLAGGDLGPTLLPSQLPAALDTPNCCTAKFHLFAS